MSDHVFISYQHSDTLFARVLMSALKGRLTYWWDENIQVGHISDETIDISIREALALIVLMSPAARRSNT